MSFDVHIRVISNDEHRPPFSGGDWFWDGGNLEVRVSKMSNWRHEAILGIHEAVEAILCLYNGVFQAAVDRFDTEYEATHDSDVDAGDDPCAPYRREHCFATAVERILAAELNVMWNEYDAELAALPPTEVKVQKE